MIFVFYLGEYDIQVHSEIEFVVPSENGKTWLFESHE